MSRQSKVMFLVDINCLSLSQSGYTLTHTHSDYPGGKALQHSFLSIDILNLVILKILLFLNPHLSLCCGNENENEGGMLWGVRLFDSRAGVGRTPSELDNILGRQSKHGKQYSFKELSSKSFENFEKNVKVSLSRWKSNICSNRNANYSKSGNKSKYSQRDILQRSIDEISTDFVTANQHVDIDDEIALFNMNIKSSKTKQTFPQPLEPGGNLLCVISPCPESLKELEKFATCSSIVSSQTPKAKLEAIPKLRPELVDPEMADENQSNKSNGTEWKERENIQYLTNQAFAYLVGLRESMEKNGTAGLGIIWLDSSWNSLDGHVLKSGQKNTPKLKTKTTSSVGPNQEGLGKSLQILDSVLRLRSGGGAMSIGAILSLSVLIPSHIAILSQCSTEIRNTLKTSLQTSRNGNMSMGMLSPLYTSSKNRCPLKNIESPVLLNRTISRMDSGNSISSFSTPPFTYKSRPNIKSTVQRFKENHIFPGIGGIGSGNSSNGTFKPKRRTLNFDSPLSVPTSIKSIVSATCSPLTPCTYQQNDTPYGEPIIHHKLQIPGDLARWAGMLQLSSLNVRAIQTTITESKAKSTPLRRSTRKSDRKNSESPNSDSELGGISIPVVLDSYSSGANTIYHVAKSHKLHYFSQEGVYEVTRKDETLYNNSNDICGRNATDNESKSNDHESPDRTSMYLKQSNGNRLMKERGFILFKNVPKSYLDGKCRDHIYVMRPTGRLGHFQGLMKELSSQKSCMIIDTLCLQGYPVEVLIFPLNGHSAIAIRLPGLVDNVYPSIAVTSCKEKTYQGKEKKTNTLNISEVITLNDPTDPIFTTWGNYDMLSANLHTHPCADALLEPETASLSDVKDKSLGGIASVTQNFQLQQLVEKISIETGCDFYNPTNCAENETGEDVVKKITLEASKKLILLEKEWDKSETMEYESVSGNDKNFTRLGALKSQEYKHCNLSKQAPIEQSLKEANKSKLNIVANHLRSTPTKLKHGLGLTNSTTSKVESNSKAAQASSLLKPLLAGYSVVTASRSSLSDAVCFIDQGIYSANEQLKSLESGTGGMTMTPKLRTFIKKKLLLNAKIDIYGKTELSDHCKTQHLYLQILLRFELGKSRPALKDPISKKLQEEIKDLFFFLQLLTKPGSSVPVRSFVDGWVVKRYSDVLPKTVNLLYQRYYDSEPPSEQQNCIPTLPKSNSNSSRKTPANTIKDSGNKIQVQVSSSKGLNDACGESKENTRNGKPNLAVNNEDANNSVRVTKSTFIVKSLSSQKKIRSKTLSAVIPCRSTFIFTPGKGKGKGGLLSTKKKVPFNHFTQTLVNPTASFPQVAKVAKYKQKKTTNHDTIKHTSQQQVGINSSKSWKRPLDHSGHGRGGDLNYKRRKIEKTEEAVKETLQSQTNDNLRGKRRHIAGVVAATPMRKSKPNPVIIGATPLQVTPRVNYNVISETPSQHQTIVGDTPTQGVVGDTPLQPRYSRQLLLDEGEGDGYDSGTSTSRRLFSRVESTPTVKKRPQY